MCAETVALASANAQGRLADVEALAVAGGIIQPDGSISGHDPVRPCGRCRQILHEAEHVAERPISIYCASAENGPVERHSVAELLPYPFRSEEHTSELQSLMRISYAVFCLKKKKKKINKRKEKELIKKRYKRKTIYNNS